MATWRRQPGEALGRRPWRIVPCPGSSWQCRRLGNGLRQALGGGAQILTRARCDEIFHPDWSVHDRRLAAAIGFRPRYDLTAGFRDTILWYRAKRLAIGRCETRRNKLSFH